MRRRPIQTGCGKLSRLIIATSTSRSGGKVHLATSLDGLGTVLQDKGDTTGALENRRGGLAIREELASSILTMHITADSWPFLTTTSGYLSWKLATLLPLWRTTEQNSIYLNRWAPPIQKTFKRDGTGRLRITDW